MSESPRNERSRTGHPNRLVEGSRDNNSVAFPSYAADNGCLIKLYDNQYESLRLHDLIEVFGIYTVDPVLTDSFPTPSLQNSTATGADEYDAMTAMILSEFEFDPGYCQLPLPSTAPRLHGIVVRKSVFTSTHVYYSFIIHACFSYVCIYIHRFGSGYPMLKAIDPKPHAPLPDHVQALVMACVKGSAAAVDASSMTNNSYSITPSLSVDTVMSPVDAHRARDTCIELLSDACSGGSGGGDRTLAEYILYSVIAHVYDRRADGAAATGTVFLGHFPLHIADADAALATRLSAVIAELTPRTVQVRLATCIFIYHTCMVPGIHAYCWYLIYCSCNRSLLIVRPWIVSPCSLPATPPATGSALARYKCVKTPCCLSTSCPPLLITHTLTLLPKPGRPIRSLQARLSLTRSHRLRLLQSTPPPPAPPLICTIQGPSYTVLTYLPYTPSSRSK